MSELKPSIAYSFTAMVPLSFVVSGPYSDTEIVEAITANMDAMYGPEQWSLVDVHPATIMDLVRAGLIAPTEEDLAEDIPEAANDNVPSEPDLTNVIPFNKKTLN